MATNPIDPNSPLRRDRQPLHTHDPKLELQPETKSSFPWPLVAILIAALLLAAIVAYMPRAPKVADRNVAGGVVPPQPFVSEIHLTGLGVAPAPIGNQTYVTGQLENTGAHDIAGITVNATFRDQDGKVVHQDTRSLEELNTKNDANTAQPFSDSPIRPGQTRAFRVAFDGVPNTWNHQPPELTIVHEDFAGGPAANSAGSGSAADTGTKPSGSKK